MNISFKATFIYISIILIFACDVSSSILTEKRIKEINQEITRAAKKGDLQFIENYFFDETQIYIDLDPNPNSGNQKISLQEYRELAQMSLQLMDDIEIEEEIISIEINDELEEATLVVKAAVNSSMLGTAVQEVSVSTTVFGVIDGAIKIRSSRDEIISIDVKPTAFNPPAAETKTPTSQPVENFSLSFDEYDLNSVDSGFKQQYLPICLALTKSVKKTDSEQLCSKTVSIIHQVANHLNTTPKDEINRTNSCNKSQTQSIEYLLVCVDGQIEALMMLMTQGIHMAMCLFPDSSVILYDSWYKRIQRGAQVYREHRMIVDCELKQYKYLDFDLFYPQSLRIDEGYSYRWEDYFDPLYQAVESSDNASIERFIKRYTFGEDEWRDKRFIELLMTDEDSFPWLKMLINHHQPKLNFNVEYYSQPLSYAIEESNNQKIALFLLEHGADPLIPYEYGQSNLQLAAQFGMYDLVKALLNKGMDPDGLMGSENSYFGQPLIQAANRGDQLIFDLLLEQGALLKPLNPSDYPDWKADDLFAQAVRGGNLDIIQTLIDKGTDIPSTKSTWVNLISGNQPELMALLRSHGLTLPPINEHEYLFSALSKVIDRADLTTLENAFTIFNSLEEMGFDLSQSFNPNKSLSYQLIYNNLTTPITFKQNPDDAAIKMLRNDFAQAALTAAIKDGIDINQSNENQTTLLMHAAKLGQHHIIKSLLEYDADANLRDEDGHTALQIAEKQAKKMSAYHPQDSMMQKKYEDSIALLKHTSIK